VRAIATENCRIFRPQGVTKRYEVMAIPVPVPAGARAHAVRAAERSPDGRLRRAAKAPDASFQACG